MSELAPGSVLIMAGGTGGHVFPALAAAACLQAKGIHVEWLGTHRGIESRLVPAANIPIHYIGVSGLRGKGVINIVKGLLQLFSAIFQAAAVLRKLKPICVLGMGGFASGPGGFAAWLSGRPLVIHEQNAVAGTTNKLLARFAREVLLGYPIGLGGNKARFIGNPVRADIAQIPPPEQRCSGRTDNLRLLVLGGSLGAKPINDVMPKAIEKIAQQLRPNIWHQAGKDHAEQVSTAYVQAQLAAKVEPFIEDMAAAYEWADLVVCRAGALTVAELAAAGVASILVPLPQAIDDHQTENARWLASNDAGLMLSQSTMTASSMSELLDELMHDRTRLLSMSQQARALAKTDAAEQVALRCLEVAYD